MTLLRVWGPVALFVSLCVGGAAVYVAAAPKRYTARAAVLVLPVPATDTRYEGLPVLRDERGRSAVQTAASLVTTSELAQAVRDRLGLRRPAVDLLGSVRARPAGRSSVLYIRATSSDPATAAKIANGFADLLLAERTATLNSAIVDATTRTLQALVALPAPARAGTRGIALRTRLAGLRSLGRSTDPSLQVVGHALSPKHPSAPRRAPILLGTLGGALVLGGLAGLLATWRRLREGAPYDQAVTERLVAQLEQRLGARMEAMFRALQEELSGRVETPAPAPAPAGAPPEPAEREQALAVRVRVLTARERELARRAGELAARERQVKTREREVETREREVETRERELEARAEELTRRAGELEERAAAAAAPPPVREAGPLEGAQGNLEVPPLREAEPAPNVTELPRRSGEGGRWNLNELSHLVEERGPEFSDRVDEWNSYLFFLRSYAAPDGTVPSSFDWLIEETFAELVSGPAVPAS